MVLRMPTPLRKLLLMSDSPLLATGYANQTRGIAKRLARIPDLETSVLGCQYIGSPMWVDHDGALLSTRKRLGSYHLLPRSDNSNSPYCEDILRTRITEVEPEILWILLDMFMVQWIHNYDISPAKFIMYFPSDGFPLPVWTDQVLKKAQARVAMSKFGQEQAWELGIKDCGYIPHGTETNLFFPRSEAVKLELRRKWGSMFRTTSGFPVNLEDKFIVGSVARFQPRKMIYEMLKVFRDFSKDKKNVFFFCHMNPNDQSMIGSGGNFLIMDLIKKYGLENKIVFTGAQVVNGLTDQQMAELYNLFDVHVLTTSGEGFGIPTIEAQASGVPSVITDFTTSEELIGEDRGIRAKLATTITGTYNVERGMVDKDDFVKGMNTLYHDPQMLKQMAKKCREFAVKNFDMDSVVFPQWEKLFREVLGT